MRPYWLLLALLAGCPSAPVDEPADDDDDATTPEEVLEGWEGVFGLIEFRCGCHDAQERAGGMWDLTDPDTAWDVLVDVPSDDVPTIDRVEPGDPDASYLFLKITDRHGEVGGAGDRMPPTGFALPEDDIAMIRVWIEDGALAE